jgi:glyoxylase-like metal-dependent hydrolase (beta-lactamase superfamily II)
MGGSHHDHHGGAHHGDARYAGPPDPVSEREERQPAQDDAFELAPGLLRVQLPITLPGLAHVNCYVLPDDKGVTVVDPGLPGPQAWKALKERLARADVPVARVHTVVVTHSHPDHFGQAGRLLEENRARVITHRAFRTFFDPDEEPDGMTLDDEPTTPVGAHVSSYAEHVRTGGSRQGRPWGGPTPWGSGSSGLTGRAPLRGGPRGPGRPPLRRRLQYRMMRMIGGRMGAVPRPTHRVDDAERIQLGGRSWVSVHTPGHTADHLCLYDPEAGILVSGDHVLPTITPHISGVGVTLDPLTDFFRSLEKVAELDVKMVLPAHGLEFQDVAARATAIRHHHEERLQRLRDASAQVGWATVPEYSTHLFPPRSLGQMADSETYAHLEHLRLTGEASVRDDGPELLYSIG